MDEHSCTEQNDQCTCQSDLKVKCDICHTSLLSIDDLVAHRYTHTVETIYNCLICGKTFDFNQGLCLHIDTSQCVIHSSANKVYNCDICQTQITGRVQLVAHRYTHTEDTYITCLICFNIYPSKIAIVQHILKVHLNAYSSYPQCDICYQGFVCNSNLAEHMRLHSVVKPFECDVCYKRCLNQAALSKHSLTHIGEKRFHCVICDIQFTQECDLTMHKRTHTEYKQYECDICKEQFLLERNLTAHRLLHTGDKQSNKNSQLTSYGEKPYECDICQKRFKQNSSLKTHRFTHDLKDMYVDLQLRPKYA